MSKACVNVVHPAQCVSSACMCGSEGCEGHWIVGAGIMFV